MTMSVDPVPHQRPLRVLVVDDAPDIRALLRAMLGDRGDVLMQEASGVRRRWPWPRSTRRTSR